MTNNSELQDTAPKPGSSKASRKVFDIYNIYRLVLGLILLITYSLGTSISRLGNLKPDLFSAAIILYLVFNLLVLFRVFLKQSRNLDNVQFIFITLADIFFLTFISYTCGGVSSGMTHLLIFPVAAGSIYFRSKLGAFFAAIATIGALFSEIFLFLTIQPENDFFFQVGILGLTLFTISLVLGYLGNRIRLNEELALIQAENIASLQEMNFQIIQRMQTGIIVVDELGNIININSAAYTMLSTSEHQYIPEPETLPDVMLEHLEKWKSNSAYKTPPVRFNKSTPQIQASFSYLQNDKKTSILIFLEDYGRMSRRMQHLKMMSLGRLTASIAHEIRNPLGAISHASQLLMESDTVTDADKRLLEIIENHSDRVNAIIESILQLSRNNNEVPDSIHISEWLETFTYKFTNSNAENVELSISVYPEDLELRFNQVQLEQILTNLCENGIRYNLAQTGNARVSINAYIHPELQSPVLDVLDEGKGLTKENESRLFEPFFTTENTGTGLGLFICKEICEANQSSLSYSRTDENLTCFRITFPHQNRKVD